MYKKENCLIIPVYNNEENINNLLKEINKIFEQLSKNLEVLFVIDGSPDNCYQILKNNLGKEKFSSKIISLSRNFGALNAMRSGLQVAKGKYFAIMSADLQEPPELIIKFFKTLRQEKVQLVVGKREGRSDPFFSKFFSNVFWFFYKKIILKEIPKGGVDVFGCNEIFRDNLLKLNESNSSLIAQIFWIGFKRKEIKYTRLRRKFGISQWSFKKKFNYMLDSVFSFSDLPIKLITFIGILGILFFSISSLITLMAKLLGKIDIPGYTTIFLSIGLIGAINIFGLGVIGSYAWRTYENTKARPLSIIQKIDEFN